MLLLFLEQKETNFLLFLALHPTSATVTISVDTYVSVTNELPRFLIMKEGMQEIEDSFVFYAWNFNEGCH